ncbi:MAG: ankyrin repeat domain-containing protein [Micavibrio sp.]|nr:MAG: ankyrin repeat domain-containing protein [Micavibrio sp.]
MFSLFNSKLCDMAYDGDLKGVRHAVENGTDANERGLFRVTPLIAAAANGCDDVVKYLLSRPETNVNTMNADSTTALMAAARGGHTGTVKILLADPRCDANILGKWGGTALVNAAAAGHADVVEEFLKIDGISLAATYIDKKYSPVTIARHNGHEAIAKRLEEFQAAQIQKTQIQQRRPSPGSGMRI